MKVTIDRFEGQYAICEKENLDMINIKRDKLPIEAKEGDILIIEGETIKIDNKETQKRKKRIEKLMDDLWE